MQLLLTLQLSTLSLTLLTLTMVAMVLAIIVRQQLRSYLLKRLPQALRNVIL